MIHAIAYLATASVFFALDLLWLGVVARRFYREQMGALLLERPNWGAALAFYAVYVIGIVVFAVAPALAAESARAALIRGALFGFFAYATYDMTNYATLRGWPVAITFVDIAWGTALTGLAALAGYMLTRLLAV